MTTIHKKVWPEYFNDIITGQKKFELRLNDFEVNKDDILVLEEWDPKVKDYTGRKIEKKVTYVRDFRTDKLFWPKEEIDEKGFKIISFE